MASWSSRLESQCHDDQLQFVHVRYAMLTYLMLTLDIPYDS